MPSRFDWVRQCRTGAELLATLRYFETHPEFSADDGELGPPHSALQGPCQRCWRAAALHATADSEARYCSTCQAILNDARQQGTLSRHAVVVWGFVNQLPRPLRLGLAAEDDPRENQILARYVHDEHHFLLMVPYRRLRPWLQELALYHGDELKGLLQIVPTTGGKDSLMGELLCRMVHNEARFPADRLRVRFFAEPFQIFHPRLYDREGVLTFEADEFLRMLDTAVVFRSVLLPDSQQLLHQLLTMEDTGESQFYWGRFLGELSPAAKDMLSAWKIRAWSKPQIELFYELVEYVGFYPPR
jgi:hypothetical protein